MVRFGAAVLLVSAILCCCSPLAAAMDDWLPISQDELKMAFDPAHPMDAIMLYHEETTDDITRHAYFYKRVKILTEKGKAWASVHIPYNAGSVNISDIKARSIAPDGTITPLTDKALDSTLAKGHGVKYQAKTLNLPNVQVGSIIEWKYTEYWDNSLHGAHWSVQDELLQKRAKFTFIAFFKAGHYVRDPARDTILDRVYYSFIGLPPDTSIKTIGDNRMELELKDIPAFEEEAFSPPPEVVRMRVNFYYGTDKMGKPAEFWKEEGKYWSKGVERFIGHSDFVSAAAAQAISPSDTPEQKARKIYALVQKIRNVTYDRDPDYWQRLASRDNKEKRTVEDVLRNNEGDSAELTHLFIAMARAAGLSAYAMRVSDRDKFFFQAAIPNPNQLTSEIAVVALDGKDVFLDPGTPSCPFGLLAWQHTNTQGLRQTDAGTELAPAPASTYKDAISKRVARLTLSDDGSLQGRVGLAWAGEEALTRRLGGLKTDDAGRKKELEDELKALLPRGSVVQIDSITGWEDSEKQITAWFKVEVPSFATSTGQRMLVPTGLFESNSRQPFSQGERKNIVYFRYPYYTQDDVQITVPAGRKTESLPQMQPLKTDFGYYQMKRTASETQLTFLRDFAIAAIAFRPSEYDELRKFYAGVTSGDSEHVVLRAAAQQK